MRRPGLAQVQLAARSRSPIKVCQERATSTRSQPDLQASLARRVAPTSKAPLPRPPATATPARRRSLPPSRWPPPPTSSKAARIARSAGHAVATAVHRRAQQCPCPMSPPPTPQAGSLAAPSRHARSRDRKRLRSNTCRRDRRSAKGASGSAAPASPPSPTTRCRRCHSENLGPAPTELLLLLLLLQVSGVRCGRSVGRLEPSTRRIAPGEMLDTPLVHHHTLVSASTGGCGSLGWPGDAGGRQRCTTIRGAFEPCEWICNLAIRLCSSRGGSAVNVMHSHGPVPSVGALG